jgi:hypothetical protein
MVRSAPLVDLPCFDVDDTEEGEDAVENEYFL